MDQFTAVSINTQENNNRVLIINQEIDGSLETIRHSKKILVNFITLYITAVFGFFYYGAYIESKTNEVLSRQQLQETDFIVLGMIGVFLVIIIFLFGWALLGLVTRTMCTTIKQYKHISYMRNLSAMMFPDGTFLANCLNPIASKVMKSTTKLPIRTASSLPYLFCLVNFMFLFSSLYFLKLFLPFNVALEWFLAATGIFAIFYPNVLIKHISELKIVQEITPVDNEYQVREKHDLIMKEQRTQRKYTGLYVFVVALVIMFVISFLLYLIPAMQSGNLNNIMLIIQGVLVIVIGLCIFLVKLMKIEAKFSYKFNF